MLVKVADAIACGNQLFDSQPMHRHFFMRAWLRGDLTMSKHDSQTKQYLSDKDLSERYGVTRQTVWRWARQGKFPSPVKINGATRWKLSDLQAWESKREVVA